MTLNWDANVDELPDNNIQVWEWNVKPSNDKGESELVTGRLDPTLVRVGDELQQEGRLKGLPIKTRADMVRLAYFRFVQDLQEYLGNQSEHITHYLLLEKQAMQEAHRSELLDRVLSTVQQFTKGMNVLADDSRNQKVDWTEIHKRLTDFLKPIVDMNTVEPLLSRLYIRGLFEYPRFSDISST